MKTQLPNVVVGAGIVGLATARALQRADPARRVLVLDKEPGIAAHQSGHNSGVIHSGLYYRPGSAKATMAVRAGRVLAEFCDEHGIDYDICGKLVVATSEDELPGLDALLARGRANGVPVRRADPGEVAEREPHVAARAALVVESTGRIDYRPVAAALAAEVTAGGGEIRLGMTVSAVTPFGDRALVRSADGPDLLAARAVAAAGLHADRLTRSSGIAPGCAILPFRGEFAALVPDRAHLVRGLVYPVPDPDLPFLGVHLTRGIDGVVHLGPNAVPATAREGYTRGRFSVGDTAAALAYPGAWRLARRYARTGLAEVTRSLSGRGLAAAARRLLPELTEADLVPAPAGVRAQAVTRSGTLVDDFLFARRGPVLHVLNAPSPAATAALLIGEHLARTVLAD